MEWRLFADLREVAGDDRVAVDPDADATVRDALDALFAARPALEARVLDDEGNVREHINVLRNGEPADLDAAVGERDELALFPPVSGG
jgi:molybdopterin synthase sulfur carrier subunit